VCWEILAIGKWEQMVTSDIGIVKCFQEDLGMNDGKPEDRRKTKK
jgi:hypothetical protein